MYNKMKNDLIINNSFPSFQKVAGELLKMPTIILLPSPPPPFEIEKENTSSSYLHTLTFNFRIMNFELKQ